MQLKINKSKDAVQETGGSSYIAKSGIYDVTITFASLAVSKGGAESVNFNLDYNGNSQTIYGPYVTDKEGNTLEVGAKLINKLGIIAGMDEDDEFEIEQEEHTVGKDNKLEEFAVITNFSSLPIKIHLQEEYSIIPEGFNKAGQIRKSMVIKNFFREDGASAEEIVDGTEIGKRLTQVQEKYASNITYKDNLTAEDIEAWREEKVKGAASNKKTPTPKATNTGVKKSLFK